jgi:DNA-directed RNA polymerase subunit H
MKKSTPISQHTLVPTHEKISQKEVEELYAKHNIGFNELPKILISDAALAGLELKGGDIVKITRISPTAGISVFYRGVINE